MWTPTLPKFTQSICYYQISGLGVFSPFLGKLTNIGCTPCKVVVREGALLRRVPRRVLETAFEKVLRRVLRSLAVGV